MIRQSHFIAVVGAFLIGCAVLVVAGCAGVRSEAPQEDQQAHTEATASEQARCEGTRHIKKKWRPGLWTTNDVPGCPKGGLLSGTDGIDKLYAKDGDDEIHSLGGDDWFIYGGYGDDVIYGGPGDDIPMGGPGDDVLYGGAGGDEDMEGGKGEDVIYGGAGSDDPAGGPGEDVLYGGRATISWTEEWMKVADPGAGGRTGTSSIAVKVGTTTGRTSSTTWTAAARRNLGPTG